jgi:hypothetical protein
MAVLLATLGQRPEAITMALDVLHPRYHYAEVGLLHTHPTRSGIADALRTLTPRLEQDYEALTVQSFVITGIDGRALIDITDQYTAEGYYRGVLDVLRRYRVQYIPVHLLVAGGRKAMSIYATLAASLIFGEHDRIWTVLTPTHLMQPDLFHAPVGQGDHVHVVELPRLISRVLPGTMGDLDKLIQQPTPRQTFLSRLTEKETELTEWLKQHPYASNAELGELLNKSERTIENQLRAIYQKLMREFDVEIDANRKRHVLIDVITGRV